MEPSTPTRIFTAITMLIVATLMLAACGGASSASLQTSSAQTQSSPQLQANSTPAPTALVRKADFGAWSYFAQRMGHDTIRPFGGNQINPGDIYATVNYKSDTADQVRSYVDANRSQLPKVEAMSGKVEVRITFRNYLQPDQFRNWVKTYNLSQPWSLMRAIDDPQKGNGYITMSITPTQDDPDPLPQFYMNFHLSGLKDHHPGAVFKGVYFTRGWVDAGQLAAIVSDTNVYFVDVTPNLVRMDLAANGIDGGDKADVTVEPDTPFHTMELVGLDQFK